MLRIENMIGSLERAKSDSDKMALLLIVAELIKSQRIDAAFAASAAAASETKLTEAAAAAAVGKLHARLFESIGAHFLARLLTTRQRDTDNTADTDDDDNDDSNLLLYKSTSLSIINQFAAYPDLICDPVLVSKLSCVAQILTRTWRVSRCSTVNVNKSAKNNKLEIELIKDAYKYLFALSEHMCEHLCQHLGLLSTLVRDILVKQVYKDLENDENENDDDDAAQSSLTMIACKLFVTLCRADTNNSNNNSNKTFASFRLKQIDECLRSLLAHASAEQNAFDTRLLAALDYLTSLDAACLDKCWLRRRDEHARSFVRGILAPLLKSKLNARFKHAAIRLMRNVTRLYGVECLMTSDEAAGAGAGLAFFYLCIHLVCIEISMSLHMQTESESRLEAETLARLCVYFELLEQFIVAFATSPIFDEQDPASDDNMQQEQQQRRCVKILVETLDTVSLFVNECLEAHEKDSAYERLTPATCAFVVACIRLLTCWLAHEDLLRDQIVGQMPRIIRFCEHFQRSSMAHHNQLNMFELIVPCIERLLDAANDNKSNAKASTTSTSTNDPVLDEFEASEINEEIAQLSGLLDKCRVYLK